MQKIAIVGSPNVGKSAVFNALTGSYTGVSNYPGTTVEVFSGKMKIGEEEFEVLDTPGMYSFLPMSEEERVTRAILLDQQLRLVLHVVDAKNLERMLGLSIQFIECGLSLILVLNIIDEAKDMGISIDSAQLSKALSVPVVETSAISQNGMDRLKKEIENYVNRALK